MGFKACNGNSCFTTYTTINAGSVKPVDPIAQKITLNGRSYTLPKGYSSSDISSMALTALSQIESKIYSLAGNATQTMVEMQKLIDGFTFVQVKAPQNTQQALDSLISYYFGSKLTSLDQLPTVVANMKANCTSGLCVPSEPPTTSGKLNDTGIIFGGNYPDGNNATCTGETIGSQDCSHGRDATHNDNSDGHAGFSFTKLSKTGASLPASAADWACIKDNVTGLVWENKTTDGGIHDTNKTYRWGGVGAQIVDGKTFGDRYADWDVLVNGSNSEKLCGFSDWRMPSRGELHSIVNYYTYKPAIDTAFFANTQSNFYWSSSPDAAYGFSAWGVYFSSGDGAYDNDRGNYVHARLVRGGQ